MEKRILSFSEACELTGFSPSYLYKLTHLKKISFSKPLGKKLFFDREKLEAFLMSNPSRTEKELEVEAATYITTK